MVIPYEERNMTWKLFKTIKYNNYFNQFNQFSIKFQKHFNRTNQ